MARRRSRRSPVESFVNRAVAWLVALGVLLTVISSVFQSAPGLGLFLFVVLPVTVGGGVLWFRRRAHEAAEREALEQARERVEAARHIGALLTGSGPDFELAVADVLRAHGYDLHRVGGSGDRGVDLTGTDAGGWKVVVQCKRYGPDNKVGSREVQSFMGTVVNQDASRGIFVTTATYTRQASELVASSRVAISLIDGTQFTRMAATAGQAQMQPVSPNPTLAAPTVAEPTAYPTWPTQPPQETQPPYQA